MEVANAPTASGHVANKAYVDASVSAGGGSTKLTASTTDCDTTTDRELGFTDEFSVVVCSDGAWEKLHTATLFSSHTFTNCGETGRTGPILVSCLTEYAGSSVTSLDMTTQGIQEWTVPNTGTYQIAVAGAQGGYAYLD